MRLAALLALVGTALASEATAQLVLDPCRPPVTAGPTAVSDLGAAAFGVDEVAQLCLVPDPAGGFEGMATVRPSGGTAGFDILHFQWPGPGSSPITTTLASALNGPDDEFQAALDRTRGAVVFDTGPGHPIGSGQACVATRSAPGLPFGQIHPLTGVPAGPIDPALGRLGGRDVLFFVGTPSIIRVGDVDLVSSSPTYGQVSNVRVAVDGTTIPHLAALHSPTPQYDADDTTVGLVLGAWVDGTGSDAWYQSVPELAPFPVTASQSLLLFALHEHGADWLGNPALVGGTAIYARGLGDRYLDPERYDFFALTSASVPATGGTARHIAQLPLGHANGVAAVLQIGVRSPAPIDLRALGLAGHGALCVTAFSVGPPVVAQQGELTLDFVVPAVPPGTVADLECLAVDLTGGQIWISNAAVLEIRP